MPYAQPQTDLVESKSVVERGTEMTTEITRRNLFKGALLGMAGAASAGMLAGCAPKQPSAETTDSGDGATSAGATDAAADYAGKVTETEEVDIVVVGAGASGLAAAVEALNQGADVLVLESQTKAGGNGSTTSVVMGVGTKMQQDLGIALTPAEIIDAEMETFNYSVDGVRWSSLVRESDDNIQWLIDQGCLFNGKVDNYGVGIVDTGHWWTGDTGRDGETGYVVPMVARVEELGGRIRYEAAGKALIMEEGAASGVYAEIPNGVLQVNAKAVIVATGGYANNDALLEERGYNPDEMLVFGVPGHDGDGINMALAAGAKSWMQNSSLMEYPMNPHMGKESVPLSRMPNGLWVNGNGVRFVDENCGAKVPARAALAVRTQDITYTLVDESLLDTLRSADESFAEVIEKAVADGAIFKADTVEALAETADIDAAALTATLETYNGYCAAGNDEEFGKDPACLQTIGTAPFYLSENSGIYFLTTIGGIDTTELCEVRAEEGGVIKGLYAVGVDGVELYKGLYTIDIPGSCNANNIYTGRVAAQQACALIA